MSALFILLMYLASSNNQKLPESTILPTGYSGTTGKNTTSMIPKSFMTGNLPSRLDGNQSSSFNLRVPTASFSNQSSNYTGASAKSLPGSSIQLSVPFAATSNRSSSLLTRDASGTLSDPSTATWIRSSSISIGDASGSLSGLVATTPKGSSSLPAQSAVLTTGLTGLPQITGSINVIPNYTIADAFAPGLSTTTITASNGAVLVYSIQTFSSLATITGPPVLIQTTLVETLADKHSTTFVGGIWVGSGGRYWGPPGIPSLELGGVEAPCIWPFCSGKAINNGEGGGDPDGVPRDPAPPPPSNPDDPNYQSQPDNDQSTTYQSKQQSTPDSTSKTSTSMPITSITSSIQSSCTLLETISNCNVTCNANNLRIRAHSTAPCSTFCYSTTAGCSITGTTATTTITASSTPVQYMIVPSDAADITTVKAIYSFLKANFDPNTIFPFIPDNPAIASDSFFIIPQDPRTQPTLTDSQIANIKSQSGVASVVANKAFTDRGGERHKIISSIESQTPTLTTFSQLSWAPEQTLWPSVSGPRRNFKKTASPVPSPSLYQHNKNRRRLPKRDGVYIREENPPDWHLKVISQPPDAGLRSFFPDLDYVYDANQGSGTYCYLIGTGVATDHDEFAGQGNVSPDWLWGPSYPPGTREQIDSSDRGHETCTGSLITGKTSGVSKQATLIPVKIKHNLFDLLWVFSAIADHIDREHLEPGWITIYFGTFAEKSAVDDHPAEFSRIERRMRRLLGNDIVIIVPAGNFGEEPGREYVDNWPAIRESSDFPLIVVGSSDMDGLKSEYSQYGPHVDVWAPGESLDCASLDGHDIYRSFEGDCGATAIVVGLTNYWLSFRRPPFSTRRGRLCNNIKEFYRTDSDDGGGSYVRTGGDVRVVWNLLDGYSRGGPEICIVPADARNRKRDTATVCNQTSTFISSTESSSSTQATQTLSFISDIPGSPKWPPNFPPNGPQKNTSASINSSILSSILKTQTLASISDASRLPSLSSNMPPYTATGVIGTGSNSTPIPTTSALSSGRDGSPTISGDSAISSGRDGSPTISGDSAISPGRDSSPIPGPSAKDSGANDHPFKKPSLQSSVSLEY